MTSLYNDIKITADGKQVIFRKNGDIDHDGNKIGTFHKITSYPMSLTDLSGKALGSYTSTTEAARAILAASGALGQSISLDGVNIFPDDVYILRVSGMVLIADPDPKIKPCVMAKTHYNSFTTTGKSAASKPAKVKTLKFDLGANKIFDGKREFKAKNQKQIVGKVKAAVTEALGGES